MSSYRLLQTGDLAPDFKQNSSSNPNYNFSTVAGRYILLCFYGSAADPAGQKMLQLPEQIRTLLDDDHMAFFGISNDPQDRLQQRVRESMPGIRFIWDDDLTVSRLYGAVPLDVSATTARLRRFFLLLKPNLQVHARFDFDDSNEYLDKLISCLHKLPPVDAFAGQRLHAPVLLLQDIFDADLCRQLIHYYENRGGNDSGFMEEKNGKTVGVIQHQRKKRNDCYIEDDALKSHLRRLLSNRISPWLLKAFHYRATRIERYLVGCYDAKTHDHFSAHRDNTTKATMHRQFAVSVFLNDNYEGGELVFPEFGHHAIQAKTGSACVFSGSLMHMVRRVTIGKRYVFIPFLFDEAANTVREANEKYLAS